LSEFLGEESFQLTGRMANQTSQFAGMEVARGRQLGPILNAV
jgi:hypothetical protein